MFDQIKKITEVQHQALSGLVARQKVTANNLANVDTPSYKGFEVLFEGQLKDKIAQYGKDRRFVKEVPISYTHQAHMSLDFHEPIAEPILVRQLTDTNTRNDKNNIDLDQEMTKMAQTNLTYNAVAQTLSGKLQGLKYVISEGGR